MKQRIYKITKETDKVVFLNYNGAECAYAKTAYKSVDDFLDEVDKDNAKWEKVKEKIAQEHASMTEEERASREEADRALFERWQDESNTNAYLGGVIIEGEDTDYNPFRK